MDTLTKPQSDNTGHIVVSEFYPDSMDQAINYALTTDNPDEMGKCIAFIYNNFYKATLTESKEELRMITSQLSQHELRRIQIRSRDLGVVHWDECIDEVRLNLFGSFIYGVRFLQDIPWRINNIKSAKEQ